MRKTGKVAFLALFVVLISAAIVGCGGGGAAKSKTGPAVNLKGDAQAGRVVFLASCVACHGPEGSGGVPNAGSTDGTIPELKPIDEGFASTASMDKVIEHGAVPEGDSPEKKMPAFGDEKILTPQQIADVIAFVQSINVKK